MKKISICEIVSSGIGQQSILFQVDYPEISGNIIPRHRFMSAYEQKIKPPDMYVAIQPAAKAYETIEFCNSECIKKTKMFVKRNS